jgi:hypothetical protein
LLLIPLIDYEETDYLAGVVTLLIDLGGFGPGGATIHIDWVILGAVVEDGP